MSWPRVLADPPRHPYVDRLHGRVARMVHVDVPAALRHDPSWIASHALDWDVAHLHLGLDTPRMADPAAVVAAHREAGVPVVCTVHDLQPPHLSTTDTAVADDLAAVADDVSAILALSQGTATVVGELTGRPARVVPHGPVVSAARRTRLRTQRRVTAGGPGHVLVPLTPFTPNVGLEELAAACCNPGPPVRILVGAPDLDRVSPLVARTSRIRLMPVDPEDTEALERAVASAAAVLVPWRWGGSSPVVELAADVGTPVLATDVGDLADQHLAAAPIPLDGTRIDVDALAAAIARLPDDARPPTECDRERAEHAFTCHHERLYHRLLLGVGELSLTG